METEDAIAFLKSHQPMPGDREMNHVFLNPDGTQDLGLLLIVEAETGVKYSSQVGGHLCDTPSVQGFLIPLGQPDLEKKLFSFFERHWGGHGYPGVIKWDEAKIEELAEVVSEVVCWHTNENGDDTRLSLELDTNRIEECQEAWVPVQSKYGLGVLTFKNSD